jgi:hypothetical protein
MAPPEGVQLDPLQQRLGFGAACGVQISPVPHAPVVSQRQPRVPTMQVDGAPTPEPPLPEPEAPEPFPELDIPEPLLDPVDEPPKVLPPASGPSDVDDEPPHAHITRTSASEPTMVPRRARDVRSVMASPPR